MVFVVDEPTIRLVLCDEFRYNLISTTCCLLFPTRDIFLQRKLRSGFQFKMSCPAISSSDLLNSTMLKALKKLSWCTRWCFADESLGRMAHSHNCTTIWLTYGTTLTSPASMDEHAPKVGEPFSLTLYKISARLLVELVYWVLCYARHYVPDILRARIFGNIVRSFVDSNKTCTHVRFSGLRTEKRVWAVLMETFPRAIFLTWILPKCPIEIVILVSEVKVREHRKQLKTV